jgi:undecaprenyl pyrophosphate synthase
MKLGSKQGDASLEKYLSCCLEKYNSKCSVYALSVEQTSQALFNKERT